MPVILPTTDAGSATTDVGTEWSGDLLRTGHVDVEATRMPSPVTTVAIRYASGMPGEIAERAVERGGEEARDWCQGWGGSRLLHLTGELPT